MPRGREGTGFFATSGGILCESEEVRFRFISSKTGQHPVAWMCRLLRVSRSGFYAWRCRGPSLRAQRDAYLTVRIRAIFEQFEHTYGSPRIYDELVDANEAVSRKRVVRIMQQEGLCALVPRRYRKTTDSNHDQPIAPNVVNRDFNPTLPNQVWASDISYVRTWQGWVYLAVGFCRKAPGLESAAGGWLGHGIQRDPL